MGRKQKSRALENLEAVSRKVSVGDRSIRDDQVSAEVLDSYKEDLSLDQVAHGRFLTTYRAKALSFAEKVGDVLFSSEHIEKVPSQVLVSMFREANKVAMDSTAQINELIQEKRPAILVNQTVQISDESKEERRERETLRLFMDVVFKTLEQKADSLPVTIESTAVEVQDDGTDTTELDPVD